MKGKEVAQIELSFSNWCHIWILLITWSLYLSSHHFLFFLLISYSFLNYTTTQHT